MAGGRVFKCSACSHAFEAWDEGNPYYVDERGEKRYEYHPSPARARCIGNDTPTLCLSCGAEIMLDSAAPLSRSSQPLSEVPRWEAGGPVASGGAAVSVPLNRALYRCQPPMESCVRVTGVLLAGALLSAAERAQAQVVASDTLPAAVVQRFIDAANARQLDAMMGTVAAGAVFGALPDDGHSLTGRDGVRAQYARMLAALPAGYTVRVASRIVDGAFVTDLERFAKPDGSPDGQATWIYYVTGGQIQRAWSLRLPRTRHP